MNSTLHRLLEKYSLLLNTIRYLKLKQIIYRFYYALYKNKALNISKTVDVRPINFTQGICYYSDIVKFEDDGVQFSLLNRNKEFSGAIDWEYNEFGKLWTYNLNYFDFLLQEEITSEDAFSLIQNYCHNEANLNIGLDPYCISLRGVNWIKFLSSHKINDTLVNEVLYKHYLSLLSKVEYHILGNHLLENGFSLLFAAYYFKDEKFFNKASQILFKELEEQILEDGAHFELSPMYHQIMLWRVLDCINLLKNNLIWETSLEKYLVEKAKIMLSWLSNITFSNGDIPMFNDSAWRIAPSSKELFAYASKLHIEFKVVDLKKSAYRTFTNKNYECAIDMGNISASYQPGHTHNDVFNFEFQVNNKAIIVDAGTSTYEDNERRWLERSTKSHNTVYVENAEQNQVWSSFRVGARSQVSLLVHENDRVKGELVSFNKKYKHQREFIFKENYIRITDVVKNTTEQDKVYVAYHFEPGTRLKIDGSIVSGDGFDMEFGTVENIELLEYDCAKGFNNLRKAPLLIVEFSNHCETTIKVKSI